MNLAARDRRLLLWSALVFLGTLLVLFTLAVVFGERLSVPFVEPLLWLANIIACSRYVRISRSFSAAKVWPEWRI